MPTSPTPDLLRIRHPSIPWNPLLAEPLFLARYIGKVGTGTLEMINLCAHAGPPSPDFRREGGQFVQTLWRAWLTDAVLEELYCGTPLSMVTC